ncbi:uncharacterized protein PgNI_12369 [Pyricularia grisea]|uniref:DUF6606 domain-containing protein n=1 Tax=Pyricularia grisea TaxID=148305 RepID=A0A6P8AMZ3_PYRGI|nr:uncharacterized protein PgNI_12369 [Pyricularia grisea]TLD03405.1 hypothetical protein PgNI_12369 [Pyricularia grisea]
MTTNKTAFDYVVNHFFLPPKLPQRDDWTPLNGSTLQSALLASIEKFRAFVVSRRYALVNSAAAMIRRMVMAQDETGNINCDNLGKVLKRSGSLADPGNRPTVSTYKTHLCVGSLRLVVQAHQYALDAMACSHFMQLEDCEAMFNSTPFLSFDPANLDVSNLTIEVPDDKLGDDPLAPQRHRGPSRAAGGTTPPPQKQGGQAKAVRHAR